MNISFSTFDSQQTRIKPIGNCKVIGVPDISVSKASMSYADDFYKVLDIENKEYFHLVGLAAYKVTAFYDEESVSPKFVIYSMDENNTIKDKSQITITDKIFIVSNVSSSKNPVSELECLKIEGMYGGLKTTLYTKQIGVLDYANAGSYINLTEGDLFIPNFDANGMITYGFMYYDYNPDTETGDFPEYINNGEYGITVGYPGFKGSINAYFVQKGYVYNIGYLDSGIIIADSMNSMENRVKSEIYGYAKPIKHIYVYDTQQKDKTKRITTGKLSTGITYFADKTNVSTAVIRQKSANCLDVVIYK